MDAPHSFERLHPILRSLVPTLLLAASAEMFISRVLAHGGLFWLRGGRPGPPLARLLDALAFAFFNFSMLLAVGVLALLGIAALSRRTWPRPLGRALPVGLAAFAAFALVRSLLQGAVAQAAFDAAALALSLAVLAPFFADGSRRVTQAFAVLLGASLACGAAAGLTEALGLAGGPAGALLAPARRAEELLALAAACAAAGLVPWPRDEAEATRAFPQAILAALPAAAFFLLHARLAADPTEAPRWRLGWLSDLPMPAAAMGLLYAAVLFLFLFTALRAIADPRWRARGYGLAFLFLAGVHYQIAYQHLLGMIGLVLVTRGAVPADTPTRPSPAER